MRGLLEEKKVRALIAVAGLLVAAAAVAAVSVSSAQAGPARASADEISGAGATFPAPLIAVWQQRYEAARGVKVNYNPIGSGGGIAAITQKTVDFGASDAPLSPDQFSACNGCVQLPWVLSATSVMYNMPLPNNLHMSGPVLADIYLGKITNWNDARIKKLNKGVSLPDKKITVVYRSDGSGTTYNFATYLNTVSKQWKSQVGRGTTRQLADRSRRPRKLRRRRRHLPDGGRNRLRGHRVRTQEQDQVLLDAEPVRLLRAAGPDRDQSCFARRPEVQPDERADDRQPAAGQEVPQGVSDLHVLVCPAADPVREGEPAEAVRDVGADDRPAVRPAPGVLTRAVLRGRAR